METITAKGKTGEVSFDGQFVTITRDGLQARVYADGPRATLFGAGEKRIPVNSITAVQWKPANHLASGYIQFTLSGGIERNPTPGRAVKAAMTDENSVVFAPRHQAAMEAVRNAVESAITTRGAVA
jgi:hypothetical protein